MIFVDDRAGSCELVAPLAALGLPVEETRLPAGDVAFEGKGSGGKPVLVGIEYKKLPDFISSVRTERLQGVQLPAMKESYDNSWLLIEGTILYDRAGKLQRHAAGVRNWGNKKVKTLEGGMTVGELLKRVFVLHLCAGLTPWWTQNQAQTVKSIEVLYRTWTDQNIDTHQSHLGSYTVPTLVPISEFREVVMRLPEIGVKASLAVEIQFNGCLLRAFNASASTWAEIVTVTESGGTRRLGVSAGERIYDFIRKEKP